MEYHGEIPKGHHIHHILPKRLGGTDVITNLVCVTAEEHALTHMELYEKYGDVGDLCASNLLGRQLSPEQSFKMASEGGKIGGRMQYENKLGIHGMSEEAKEKGRKASIESCKRNQTGFFDPKLQSELGKRGGPKNKGFIWLTDGKIGIKYTKKMQKEKSVEDYLKEHPELNFGVGPQPQATCPHCGKKGAKAALAQWHFDKCPALTGVPYKAIPLPTRTCPHCGKIGKGGGMSQFHFDNCSVLTGVPHKAIPSSIKTCPHCGKTGQYAAMSRYHFDNCYSLTGVVIKGNVYKESTCPHCGKVGKGGGMKRYHFDNCKFKDSK